MLKCGSSMKILKNEVTSVIKLTEWKCMKNDSGKMKLSVELHNYYY